VSEESEKSGNPVLSGLVALLAVALTVGLVLGGVVLVATKWVGIGDAETASADATERESLYLPKPRKTKASGPQITLRTEDGAGSTDEPDVETESSEPTESESADKDITLQAGQTEVANFGQIDLSGVYPGGEGAILQVQRFENGQWADFDATIPVSNETFSTYVQTGVNGMNRFRVADPSTGAVSNEVRVNVLP
jgi:hypothetical protein